jgi:hypothetical protein
MTSCGTRYRITGCTPNFPTRFEPPSRSTTWTIVSTLSIVAVTQEITSARG